MGSNSVKKVKEIEDDKDNIKNLVDVAINNKKEFAEVPNYTPNEIDDHDPETNEVTGKITVSWDFMGTTYNTKQEAIDARKKEREG